MTNPQQLVHLDRANPFIAAVDRVARGEGTLDDAVLALNQAERRARAFVVTAVDPLWWLQNCTGDWVLQRRAGARPMTFGELVALADEVVLAHARDAREGAEVDERAQEQLRSRYEARHEEHVLEALERERVFPFLRETMLVVQGMDFTNDHYFYFCDGEADDPSIEAFGGWWTQREWGRLLAQWASELGWTRADGRSLDYVDFYIGADSVIDGYSQHARVGLGVIERSSRCRLESARKGRAPIAR